AQLFDEPDCRLLTLVGPGGMGKTRLALRAAERIVETHPQHGRFAQGVFFVPLEALREGNSIVSAIISAISDESGFPLHAAAPLQEQLLDFLHDKEMLLVLDNFEHLVSTAALLSTILRVAPAVKLLVTSREALGLQEEWFYPITGMSLPTMASDNLAAEVEYDAVRLFVQCARRTQPGFALAAGDQRAAMLRICQMVEGMPLAIELAAAWLMVLTPQQIVHELEHGLDILTARFQNVPVRHRSMRAVMEHSWNLLTGEEQEVAARLSVFLGGFHFAAAAEIAGASLPMLATLVEKALVRLTPDKRYQMHELVRQYFASHLQTNLQKEQATLDRHSAYYVHWLRQRGDWLRSDQQATALAEFALEADNIRAAWNRAVALRNREAMRSATFDLIDFYDWLSWFQEGEHLFAEAVQQLEESDARGSDPAQAPPALAYALLGFGAFSCRIGHYERAQEALRRTLAILRTGDDSPALSHTLYWLAMVGNHLGRYAEARLDAEEGLVLAERDNDHIMVARLLNLLAFVALFGGQYAQAEEQFARALATARRLGNQKLTILLLTNLSWSLRLQHKYEQTRQ
ncbi:MAG TPA: tetratricopeptide repeat protein, partial [Caldilineaceae bacterium]|nr:tetratricopeptide repeat protein [Caldilineaceae bacterium]